MSDLEDELDNIARDDTNESARELARYIRAFYTTMMLPDPHTQQIMPEDAAIALSMEMLETMVTAVGSADDET